MRVSGSSRSILAASGLLVALALVSGCSSDGESTGGSQSPSASGSKSGASGSPTGSAKPTATPQPSFSPIPTLKGEVGARSDATVSSCAAASGGWAAKGTVKNPTKERSDYVVVVSMLDAENRTLGVSWTREDDVKADEERSWEVAVKVTGEKLSCVLRVTRAKSG